MPGLRNGYGGAPPVIAGAQLLARTSEDGRKEAWPYAWEHCPPDGEQWHRESVVDFPALNTLTQLISYPVPDGLKLRIFSVMLYYVGTSVADGQNLVTWQLAINIPASVVGITTPVMPSNYAVPGWGAIQISKGSPQQGPWEIPGKLVFNARDVFSINVTTTGGFPTSGGQFLTTADGWEWPAEPST